MTGSRAWGGGRRAVLVAGALLAAGGWGPRVARAQADAVLDTAYDAAEHGAWDASARAWRHVLDDAPNLSGAAANTLRGAPPEARSGVRRDFLAAPVSVSARLALAELETEWGSARAGWEDLATLPATGPAVAAWVEFASGAADAGAPLVARDALAAALQARPGPAIALRAAAAALDGGDPAGALALADRVTALDPDAPVTPLRVRALCRLGRPEEADRLVSAAWADLSGSLRAELGRAVALAYARVGDVAHAQEVVRRFGLGDDPAITGWLALYAGDLALARRALETVSGDAPDIVMAIALLVRTHADSAPLVGQAFMLLSRGDSARAADAFATAATSAALTDAAPLLLATAARLHVARHEDALAVPLWRRVVVGYAAAPEAPEADLEWGRALKRGSDIAGAIERWEHLLLTYPTSALVPQARRELDLVKAAA